MTQKTEQYYAVEVPEDAREFKIEHGMLFYKASFGPIANVGRCYNLPRGNWQFLFTTKKMTEDQAAQVVERSSLFPLSFIDYDYTSAQDLITYDTAKDALLSLLRSKGLDTEKNYAILKKEA